MKFLYSLPLLLFLTTTYAQVGFGKSDFTGNPSALVDFGTESGTTVDGSDTKGLFLNPTDGIPSTTTNGTIAFVNDGTNSSFRYLENGVWEGIITGGKSTPITGSDSTGSAVIIGSDTASGGATGALILESDSKALVLPQIANGRLILPPVAGLMYYDTVDKLVWVYNGDVWVAY